MASTTRQHPENSDTDSDDVTDGAASADATAENETTPTEESGTDAERGEESGTAEESGAKSGATAAGRGKPSATSGKPKTSGPRNRGGKGSGPRGKSSPKAKALKAGGRGMGGMATSTIVMFTVVGLIAIAIIGFTAWKVWDKTRPFGEQNAQKIDGVVNYRKKDPDMLTRQHVDKPVKYKVTPPVGGNHNTAWENCEGDVYAQQIPNEHAVHSLEHGAVWVTYNPDKVSRDEIEKLARKVRGKEFTLMSPYPGLKSTVSLQAWGFRLQVDSVDDKRIDEFIVAFRKNAGVERGAGCSGGVTVTGKDALTREQLQQMQQMQQGA